MIGKVLDIKKNMWLVQSPNKLLKEEEEEEDIKKKD